MGKNGSLKTIAIGCGAASFVLLLAVIVLIAIATSQSEEKAAPEPVKVTASEVAEVEDTPEPSPSPSERELDWQVVVEAVLQSNWNDSTQESRDSMCAAWKVSPDIMVDVFMDGFGESGEVYETAEGLTPDDVRQSVRDFYDGKCLM